MTPPTTNYRDRLDALSLNKKRWFLELARRESGFTAKTVGGSRLIAYITCTGDDQPDSTTLRQHCEQHLPSYMVPQVFIPVDEIPRTSAGKVDRFALRLHDAITPADSTGADDATPRNAIETALVQIWAEVLGMEDLNIHDNFFEVGGDSLQIIRILSRAAKEGISLKPDVIFAHPTIAEASSFATLASAEPVGDEPVAGSMPLMPIQSWFFEHIKTDPHQWNQSVLFAGHRKIDPEALMTVCQAILDHHDALRSLFTQDSSGWHAQLKDQITPLPVQFTDLTGVTEVDLMPAIREQASLENARLSLPAGPLIRFVLFTTAEDTPDYLLIVAHHLVVDAESWGLLLADMELAMEQTQNKEAIKLPRKTRSIIAWSQELVDYAKRPDLPKLAAYWHTPAANNNPALPVDSKIDGVGHASSGAAADNIERNTGVCIQTLDKDLTELLLNVAQHSLNTGVHVLIVTALAQAISNWTERDYVQMDMEGHGREALSNQTDISRTIGWFTSVFPIPLQATDPAVWSDTAASLRLVKETIQALPLNGLAFGLLKNLCPDPAVREQMQALPQSQILFNYLGQVDRESTSSKYLSMVDDRCGEARSARCERAYLLEINARIREGQLQLDWSYNRAYHNLATIERLAEVFADNIRTLIDITGSDEATPVHVPSDFPLAGLSQQELDNIAASLGDDDD
ncbi:MAG: hypothetical protein HKN70_09175 [Gammaproteobacteria bacterium]|nr:hypothetical protein [Gammaproteobacteria bacterium]